MSIATKWENFPTLSKTICAILASSISIATPFALHFLQTLPETTSLMVSLMEIFFIVVTSLIYISIIYDLSKKVRKAEKHNETQQTDNTQLQNHIKALDGHIAALNAHISLLQSQINSPKNVTVTHRGKDEMLLEIQLAGIAAGLKKDE